MRNVILSLIETLHVEAQRNELGINNFAHDVVSEREIVTIALSALDPSNFTDVTA